MRERLNARDDAANALAAAERAADVLATELTAARERAAEAQRKCHQLANAVLAIEGERLAQRHSELLVEAGRITESLFAADKAGVKLGSPDDLFKTAR